MILTLLENDRRALDAGLGLWWKGADGRWRPGEGPDSRRRDKCDALFDDGAYGGQRCERRPNHGGQHRSRQAGRLGRLEEAALA